MSVAPNTKVEITKEEIDKLKDMVEELFLQRSEVYHTELNETLDAGEKVLTILQNRIDVLNPDFLIPWVKNRPAQKLGMTAR